MSLNGLCISRAAFTAVLLCLLAGQHASAAVWYVDKHNQSPTQDGTSWATAFTTLQPAIDATNAAGGGEVWVRAGVYDEERTGVSPITNLPTASLIVHEDVDLYGGFAGYETQRSQRDWTRFKTVIDGSNARGGLPAIHVMFLIKNSIVDGFEIRGGRADSTGHDGNGGAIAAYRTHSTGPVSLVVRNCVFTENFASDGGCFYGEDTFVHNASLITFEDCLFAGNEATNNAAGIAVTGMRLLLRRCTFSENAAGGAVVLTANASRFEAYDCVFSANMGKNAGVFNVRNGGVVDNCLFIGNKALYGTGRFSTSDGGAIILGTDYVNAVSVRNSSFINNEADRGAAIFVSGGTPLIENCRFINNRALVAGGAIDVRGGAPTIRGCFFQDNFGYRRGGALALGNDTVHSADPVEVEIVNSVFTGNSAGSGGAINAYQSTVVLRNNTLWENSARNSGGGIFASTLQAFTLQNNIIRSNLPSQLEQLSINGATFTHNNVEGGLSGTQNYDLPEIFVDADGGDLRLLPNSPGVNAGNLADAPALDLAGVARPQGGGVDVGAYEYTANATEGALAPMPLTLTLPGGERVPMPNFLSGYGQTSAPYPGMPQFSPPPVDALLECVQPDGRTFSAYLRGSGYFHWYELEDGAMVQQDEDKGWFHYLQLGDAGALELGPVVTQTAKGGFVPLRYEDTAVAEAVHLGLESGLERASADTKNLQGAGTLTPATGSVSILVLLANFSDTTPTYTRTDFQGLFNTPGYAGHGALGSVRDYYLEVSNAMFDPVFVVTDWMTLSNPKAYYGENTGFTRTREMAAELLPQLQASGFNFGSVDENNDGWIDGLIILHQGGGYEGGGGPGSIWSHASSMSTITVGGKSVNLYSTAPEVYSGLKTVGVIAHEFGHLLGLPDLYDLDGSSAGVGNWDLMASGTWVDEGRRPTHLSGWCKHQLGWIEPVTIDSDATDVELSTQALYRLDANMTSGEYLLLENRQQTGFDSGLPASGLLLWHIDEKTKSNQNEFLPLVGLKTAGGQIGGIYNQTAGLVSDPFPGSTGNRSVNGATNPDTHSHLWGDTGMAITNISDSTDVMTFDVAFSLVQGMALRTLALGNTGTGSLTIDGLSKSPNANWLTWTKPLPEVLAPGAAPLLLDLTADLPLAPPGVTTILLNASHSSGAAQSIPLRVAHFGDGGIAVVDSISPTADHALNFGATPINTLKAATVTLSNTGTGTLKLASLSLESSTSNVFHFTNRPTLPASLAPGGSAQFRVVYTPSASTSHGGAAVTNSDDRTAPALPVSLQGLGTAAVADSDGDGIPDSEEPAGNVDGDGLVNAQDPDADGDGVHDGVELAWGTNPYTPGSKPAIYVVYVDFAYTGIRLMTQSHPSNSLVEAASTVANNGTVYFKGNSPLPSTDETATISKKMRLETIGGPIRLGADN